jgi:hypothetical protein
MCIVDAFSDRLLYYGPPDNKITILLEGGLPFARLYHKASTLAPTVQCSV